jgi:hypothetical protein
MRLSAALTPGVWFWRLRTAMGRTDGERASPVWWFRVGERSSAIDTSWGSELDVNGDGYADVAVSSPEANVRLGRVDVFYGGPSGINATPGVTLRGPATQDGFGSALASAGDVNGDGFGDLVVGSPAASPGGALATGRITVFLGSATGLSASPSVTRDGLSMIGRFGSAVSGGDVNRDGYADLVVGAPAVDGAGGSRSGSGAAYVYFGSATGIALMPSQALDGQAAGDSFGGQVSVAGDVNGDGFADAIIAAHTARVPTGSVAVHLGSATGLSLTAQRTLSASAASDSFGWTIAAGGDVNGDGYADVAAGAANANDWTGSLSIWLGGASGVEATAQRRLVGAAMGAGFGSSASMSGDVNADGFDDVVVGAARSPVLGLAGAGRAFVFLGSMSGVSAAATHTLDGVAADDAFGSATAIVGDVNGDGVQDFVVGAINASTSGRDRAGGISVYAGVRGAAPMLLRTVFGAASGDAFGSALSL